MWDADFSPKLAKDIISAAQGFMRVLASDLPMGAYNWRR
jgi:hypothetical protein